MGAVQWDRSTHSCIFFLFSIYITVYRIGLEVAMVVTAGMVIFFCSGNWMGDRKQVSSMQHSGTAGLLCYRK